MPSIRRGEAELTGADAEHLVRVLRAEPGEIHVISDNERSFTARIETARKNSVVFQVIAENLPPAPVAVVHLYAALFKFDRFEWMLEKATELGVDHVHPVVTTRSDRGLDKAAPKRMARWERIALEASQQCRRVRRPEFHSVQPFAASRVPGCTWNFLLDEDPSAAPLSTLLELAGRPRSAQDSVALFIGPEGGWTDTERTDLLEGGWSACSLGSTILRAETAALAGLAAINVLWRR